MSLDSDYSFVVNKLRTFFISRNFIECHPRGDFRVLSNEVYLDGKLITQPTEVGFFCITSSSTSSSSTSYSNDCPLFEFTMKGSYEQLLTLNVDLLRYLGYVSSNATGLSSYFPLSWYDNDFPSYVSGTVEEKDVHCNAFFITDTPSAFWNTKKCFNVILNGQDVIRNAERSCDIEEMRPRFYTLLDFITINKC